MQSSDKLILNRHIERLIEADGHDNEARTAVAAYAAELVSSPLQIESMLRRPGGKIGGQTEHGLVEIEDQTERTTEFACGVREERVGYYKLSRHKKGKEFWIEISHF